MAEIILLACLACGRRGPEFIFFNVDSCDGDNLVRISAGCDGCGNSEIVVEANPAELNAMAAAGQQLDLSKLERFSVC